MMSSQVYDIFFELAPGGQEYFKQSATRTFVALDDFFDGLVSYQKHPGVEVHGIPTGGFVHWKKNPWLFRS